MEARTKSNGFVLLETGLNPAFAAFGHHFGKSVGYRHTETYQCTCYGSAAEALFTFVLAGEVDGSLDYIVCFLGCAQRIYHDGARTDKEVPRCFGRAEQ